MRLEHPDNRGVGAAVRTGLYYAKKIKADYVVKIDADLQHNPKDINNVLNPIIKNKADIVYGSRLKKISYRQSATRKVGNITFSLIMSFLTGWPVKDGQSGIFALNKKALNAVYLPGDYNDPQQILMSCSLKGLRFLQVEVDFYQRTSGKSFIGLIYPLKVMQQLFIVAAHVNPYKLFFPIFFNLLFTNTVLLIALLLGYVPPSIALPMTIASILGITISLSSLLYSRISKRK